MSFASITLFCQNVKINKDNQRFSSVSIESAIIQLDIKGIYVHLQDLFNVRSLGTIIFRWSVSETLIKNG